MGKSARVIYCQYCTVSSLSTDEMLIYAHSPLGFRTDLRLHDSPALKAALDLNPECLWPIFTWDPYYVYHAKGGTNRWQFL